MKKKAGSQKAKAPDRERMRSILESSEFSLEAFASAIDDLEQEIEEPDPYWLEGALDVLADCLIDLIPKKDQGDLKTSPPSEVLNRLVELVGYGGDAADALAELEGATDSSFYDDDGIDELEGKRDDAVEQLRDMHKELAELSQ